VSLLPNDVAGIVDVTRPLQCAGLNRHEPEDERALRERTSDPLGLESCAATVRDTAKRRQSRWGGYSTPKTVNPDADALVMRGSQTGQWLKSMVQGHFNYYAVPGNIDSLGVFRVG
jgi:hypothetical protein